MSNETKRGVALEPELRFPEFRGDGVWLEDSFDEFYGFIKTNSLPRDKLNYEHGTIKNIHYGDIHTKFRALFDIEKEVVPFINESENDRKYKNDSLCVEGDVIFADASEDLDDVGKSIEVVNTNGQKLVSGLHTIHVRQKKERLVVGFGGYLFQNNALRSQIKKQAQGAKVLGISAGRLSSVKICYPPNKHEQQKIADCLSSLDELIDAEEQKLDALQRHKKGLMQELFPADGETIPRRRFAEFANDPDWNISNLEGVASVSSGGTPSRTKPKYWNGNIPWVSTSLIDFNCITSANEFITSDGLKNSAAKVFPKGTILMAMYGQGKTRGKVATLGIDAAINQACAAITLKGGMNTQFAFQNLAARYEEIRRISNSGGQENLSGELVKKIPLAYPNIESGEQDRIASFLSSVDESIAAQSQKIEALQAHKKGLMQGLFPAASEVENG